jgi:LacI family transcriptional regulator
MQAILNARQFLQAGERHLPSAPSSLPVFDIILPQLAGPSTDRFIQQLKEAAGLLDLTVQVHRVASFEPQRLADQLLAVLTQKTSGVAFQALDHPLVTDTVAKLMQQDVPVLTLFSDLNESQRHAFIGTDNRMAGRTAGLMMGLHMRGQGKVAVLWASSLYRSHDERESGFRSLLRTEYSDITVLDHIAGDDDAQLSYQCFRRALAEHPDLTGVYNVGAGMSGVVRAITESGRDVAAIGHNLNNETRQYLINGDVQTIIHQGLVGAASQTLQVLSDLALGRTCRPQLLPVDIITRENLH